MLCCFVLFFSFSGKREEIAAHPISGFVDWYGQGERDWGPGRGGVGLGVQLGSMVVALGGLVR